MPGTPALPFSHFCRETQLRQWVGTLNSDRQNPANALPVSEDVLAGFVLLPYCPPPQFVWLINLWCDTRCPPLAVAVGSVRPARSPSTFLTRKGRGWDACCTVPALSLIDFQETLPHEKYALIGLYLEWWLSG